MIIITITFCVILKLSLSMPVGLLTVPFAQISTSQMARNASARTTDVCTTPSCLEIAKLFRLAINTEADPCDDFYEFACGMWQRFNPTPEDDQVTSGLENLGKQVRKEMNDMIKTLNPNMYKEKSIQLVANVYNKCMDEEAIEHAGTEPLKKEINALFGTVSNEIGHTFIRRVSSSSNSLEDLVADLWFKHGIDVLISARTVLDRNDTTNYIFQMHQAPLALGYQKEAYYLNEDEEYQTVRDAYLNLMANISALLWNTNQSSEPTESQIKDAQEILNFEIELAKLSANHKGTSTSTRLTPNQLACFGENFDLTRYISHFAPMKEVHVVQSDYLFELNSLLNKSDTNSVKGYILWMLIWHRLPYISEQLKHNYCDFMKIRLKHPPVHDRAEYCMKYLIGDAEEGTESLGYAVGRLLVDRKNFNVQILQQVRDLIQELMATSRMMLKENNWLDEETKARAYKKIDKTITKIGYPDAIMNDLDSIYEPLLELTENFTDTRIAAFDGFYEINTKINVWMRKKQNSKLGEVPNRQLFTGSPVLSDAWFHELENSVTLPVGVLQSPCYNPDFPMAVNFGCVGSIIGHEIIHAFGDAESQYDENGNSANWWTSNSKQKFNERVKCISDQYSRFCYPQLGEGICVNGNQTRRENVADNGGLVKAYRAYKSHMKNQRDLILPSFENFTQEQIFFLSHAYSLCSAHGDVALINQINTDLHSPDKARINGPYQNLKEFSDTFHCPINSPMNPEKKCTVW